MQSLPEDLGEEQLIEYAYATGLILADGPRVAHAPFFALPSHFPRSCFEEARALASPLHALMLGVAGDYEFLRECLAGADSFTTRLLGIAGRTRSSPGSGVQCAVLRSDYMITRDSRLLQVELNTISASFGALSPRVSRMHRHAHPEWAAEGRLPENEADTRIPAGLLAAWECYGAPEAVVLFLVQPNEGNRYDQLHFQYWLEARGVRVVRRTFDELVLQASLAQDGTLRLQESMHVGLVYLRAGYTPRDYTREEHWEVLERLEESRAVLVPNASWHLAGTKKVQQVLAQPGALERYVSPQLAAQISACFAGIYALDDASVARALAAPQDYVLKPQREGGGNNIYGDDMCQALRTMPEGERGAYILMELIKPVPQHNALVRKHEVTRMRTVSELGIYSVLVHDGTKAVVDEPAGHLLRTKESTVKEAGVSAGFGAFDSPYLV